jgi:hypothetical protein
MASALAAFRIPQSDWLFVLTSSASLLLVLRPQR